ncbi:7TM diverse intracellular signaling domain-containing protein [Pseudobacteriovorax antillogorgiicola]|nr:7TM diverse intracellular signaling domain-containing protein [Pseudobacteriovorax antillogorgiicola]
MLRITIITFALILGTHSWAGVVDVAGDQWQGRFLGTYGQFLVADEMSIQDILQPENQVKFVAGSRDFFHFASLDPKIHGSSRHIWARFQFANSGNHSKTIYFDADGFRYRQTDMFVNGELRGTLRLGESHNHRSIPLTIPADTQITVHFKIQPKLEIIFALRYWDTLSEYLVTRHQRDLEFSIVLAIIFMSLFFNIMLFLAYSDRTSLSYLFYLVGFAFWAISVWRVTDGLWGENDGIGVSAGVMALFATLYSMYFLSLSRFKIIFRLSQLTCIMTVLGTVYTMFYPLKGFDFLQTIVLFCSPFLLACGVFVAIRDRTAYALIYCVGYGTMIVSVLLNVLYNFNVLDYPVLKRAMLYGTSLENLFMLAAMAQKILVTEREREHSYRQLAKVFYPHQLEQMKQGAVLESTMPVGIEQACVLAFDVIGSSRADSEFFAENWEEFMSQCRIMMTDDYDRKTLRSSAYLIKEMGDVFLCSVGFPFREVGNNQSSSALDLALKFMSLFNEIMNKDPYQRPFNCSIGIAKGKVKGYFSKAGAIRHDLWGPAVVLATRYEAMRKLIFDREGVPLSNILTIQQDVYEELPPEEQARFRVINLEDRNYRVRDDSKARFLAFRNDFDTKHKLLDSSA